uniref:tRNA pseudouridine(38-40) synthase TruA n=1 Tax=Steinernema glaseri TaxID=37863 RepID=A0A1I7YZI1_9BILA
MAIITVEGPDATTLRCLAAYHRRRRRGGFGGRLVVAL